MEGLEARDAEACIFLLNCSGRMLPRPRALRQKRPCPEGHLLLLRVAAPVTSRMELQLRQSLGQLQSPQ